MRRKRTVARQAKRAFRLARVIVLLFAVAMLHQVRKAGIAGWDVLEEVERWRDHYRRA